MKTILKIEQFGIFVAATVGFFIINSNLLLFLLLFLTPDISAIGYLINNKVGAFTYNLVHNQATGVLLFIIGFAINAQVLMLASLIMIAHSAFDRVLGYGLKYSDKFQHTHLGYIGKRKTESP